MIGQPFLRLVGIDHRRFGPSHVDPPAKLVELLRRRAKNRRPRIGIVDGPEVEDRCFGIEQDRLDTLADADRGHRLVQIGRLPLG